MKKLFTPSFFSYSLFVLVFLAPSAIYAQKTEIDTICSGSPITLTATTGDSYLWSPGGETTSSVTVTPTETTKYTCDVTTNGTKINTGNLILGGDFEFAIPTGFSMGSQLKLEGSITDPITNIKSNLYTQMNNFGSGMTSETAGILNVGGAMTTTDPYLLKDNPSDTTWASTCGRSYFIHLKDHTKADGTGKMLAVDGSSGGEIWRSGNMQIKPGKTYQFSCWVANIDAQFGTSESKTDPITGKTILTSHDINTLAKLTFKIETGKGTSTFPTFTVSQTVGEWTEYTGKYTVPGTGTSTYCNISLTNATGIPEGNDFAIDDIYFGLEQNTGPVTIKDNFTVNVDTPATVTMASINVCQNAGFTLSATVSGGTNNVISWTKNENTLTGSTAAYISNTAPATVGESDTYAISVKSGVCTAVTQSATVTALSCNSTQKDTICLGNNIVLNQANTKTYSGISWSPATGLSSTNILKPTFTPATAGTFAFTMTGTNTATSLIETIYVTVKVETPATVSVDGVSQCINNPITLKAKVSGGTNNSIAWTKNGNTLSETTNEVSDTAPATINETDTYRITVTPTGVCPAVSSEATVTGTSCGVQAIINQQDIDICPGESLQLKALSSTTAHAWSTGESTQSVQVSPTTKTQYVVVSGPSIPSDVIDFLENNVSPVNVSEISDILGYQTEQYYIDIFNVTIKDCGVTTILNRIVCQGETVTVGTQTFSTSGQHSYTLVGGSYLGGDSTVILNLRVIDVAIQAPKTAICMGESLSLGATANPNTEWSATWTTQPSTGLSLSNASDTTTNASGTIAGNYTVTLTASITQSDGIYAITPHTCTATQAIVVHPNPVITDIFTTGRAATILYDQQSGTAPFTFNIGNTVYQHNELFDLPIGEYRVEIQNAEGCKSFRMFTIVPTPIIPDKFFSPNNDGVNDRWNVVGIEFYPNADIQIFDRFGKQMIRYKGSDLGWDGNYLGNPMPTTDYWYIIYVAEINETLSGHFTLKR
ncbi:MAG TPA: T9SS type B sorting domain-containing protein [Paludibacteraceae bacterium]|nr:T9SS type B sorting domain-containing protein [Paludibacteraceae bacterium]